jgi:flagellar assembly factor FliW
MFVNTVNFGELEIKEEDILTFEDGLPGFESMQKYIIVSSEDGNPTFNWLQSVENPKLAFVIIDPAFFRKDYTVDIDDLTINSLGIITEEDVSIFSIVVVPEEVSRISANLKAPLIINLKTKKGKQVILDNDEYHVRHYIMEELRKQGD